MGLMILIDNEFSIVKNAWPTCEIRIPMMTLITKGVIRIVHSERLTLICKIWCLFLSWFLTLTNHRVLGECRLPNKLCVLLKPMMFSSLCSPTPSPVAWLMVITPLRLRITWTWDLVMMILFGIFCDLVTVSYLTLAMRVVLVGAILQREVLAPTTTLTHLFNDPLLL